MLVVLEILVNSGMMPSAVLRVWCSMPGKLEHVNILVGYCTNHSDERGKNQDQIGRLTILRHQFLSRFVREERE